MKELLDVKDVESVEDAQKVLEDAWEKARKEALNYEKIMFAIKGKDEISLEEIKEMLEDEDYFEVQHK